jgi:hypothetical protein
MIYVIMVCFKTPFAGTWVQVDEKAYNDRQQAEDEGRAIMARNKDVIVRIKTYKEVYSNGSL